MPAFYLNYTSKSRFKCVNRFMNDFWQNLFHSSTTASFNESTLVIRLPWYAFCSRRSQIPKSTLDSNLDYLVASNEVIEVVSSLSTFQE